MLGIEAFWFQPGGPSLTDSGILVFASAVTSMLTAATGIGGGVLLFAIMAWQLPIAALIPVHGVVQIGSNAGRLLPLLRSVRLNVIVPFFIGSAIGGSIGAVVAIQLPQTILQIALGGFILWSAWGQPPAIAADRRVVTLTGVFSTFLTMFFGATGTFVAAMVKLMRLDRLPHVATHAACMTAQHGIKVVAFGLLGFAYAPYLPIIIMMIGAGFIGTLIGKRFLMEIANQRFQLMLSCLLTVLALGLLADGVKALTTTSAKGVVPSLSEPAEAGQGDADESLESRMVALDLENGALAEELQRDRSRLAMVERRAAEVAMERETLAATAQQRRQHVIAVEQDRKRLRKQLDSTRDILTDLEQQFTDMVKERETLIASVDQSQRRMRQLEDDLIASQQRNAQRRRIDREAADENEQAVEWTIWVNRLINYQRIYSGAIVEVEISASEQQESGTFTAWFEELTERPIAIPDLSSFGMVFIGGRVVFIENEPTAQIAYTDAEGNRLGLWLRPSGSQLHEVTFGENGDLNIVHWHKKSFEYALIGSVVWEKLSLITGRLYQAHGG